MRINCKSLFRFIEQNVLRLYGLVSGMPEWRCKDTAENCKFSHEPLTDVTRTILLKVYQKSLISSILWESFI